MSKKRLSIYVLFLVAITIFATYVVQARTDTIVSVAGLPHEPLHPGNTFELTVSITNNPGFAGMVFRIHVPPGLEATHLTPAHGLAPNFTVAPDNWDGYALSPHFTGNVFAGWNRTSNFDTPQTELFTITLRVSENATPGTTDNITISFENNAGGRINPDTPTDADGNRLQIHLENTIGAVNIHCGLATLRALIAHAQALLAETDVSTDGTDVPTRRFWVQSQAEWDALDDAITAAQEAYENFAR